jgi:hypothetical protein
MQLAANSAGKDYLEKRSRLTKLLSERPPFQRIQLIDDSQFDADVLAGGLRKVLGRDIAIDISKSITALHRQWAVARPNLIFLDDRLGHTGSATNSLPSIRRMGYTGIIVVVSGLMTRERRAELMRLTATEALHKDDLDSMRLIELLLQLTDPNSGSAAH